MNIPEHQAFETRADLENWLKDNHESESELWVKIYKKKSKIQSVEWNDCVIAAIIWGWIDSQKKSLNEVAYLQRLTPRRPKSNWSKKNRNHVEELIAEGLMQPAGLIHVDAAKEDGRWEKAYAGSADMVIPEDFLEALEKDSAAKAEYQNLKRRDLFFIYHRLHSPKKEETRQRRMVAIIDKLSRGEKLQ